MTDPLEHGDPGSGARYEPEARGRRRLAGTDSEKGRPDDWRRIPATPGYWKVLGTSLVYAAALASSALVADAVMSIPGEPSWIEVAVGIAVWASPIVVLIWGAVIASRLIRRKTGYPSSPEGLILMLVVSGISAFLISLPFEIPADYFVIVCLPFAVWVYLAILRRLFGPPAEVREGEQLLRSA